MYSVGDGIEQQLLVGESGFQQMGIFEHLRGADQQQPATLTPGRLVGYQLCARLLGTDCFDDGELSFEGDGECLWSW